MLADEVEGLFDTIVRAEDFDVVEAKFVDAGELIVVDLDNMTEDIVCLLFCKQNFQSLLYFAFSEKKKIKGIENEIRHTEFDFLASYRMLVL